MKGLRDATGELVVGRRLGAGGEGEVFALANRPGIALKVYARPDGAREAKVQAMIAAGLASRCPEAAFPVRAASGPEGGFIGFTMTLVAGGEPIHELLSPKSRRKVFPHVDWRFLVRVAANVARAFGRVHAAGAVVGDVNGAGILVSHRAVASLIDADSFQWGKVHPCRVGVPEFTPPELQGGSLDGVARTVDHDGYGLAVLIFQLLFLGRHPAAGVTDKRDIGLPEAIRQNLFAYTRLRTVAIVPPTGTLLLSDLPLEVATLFERAFAGVQPRPVPREWVAGLEALEARFAACGRNPAHWHPKHHDCPWCRIDRVTGRDSFAPAAPRHIVPRSAIPQPRTPSQVDALRFLARARIEGGEGVRPAAINRTPSPSAAARQCFAMHRATERAVQTAFAEVHSNARRELEVAVDRWRTGTGAWRASGLASAVLAELDRQAQGARRYVRDRQLVGQRLRAEAIRSELGKHAIGVATVPGIGVRTVARLNEAGITHAADVARAAVEAVPRLGERGALLLLLWRDGLAIRVGCRTTIEAEAVDAARKALDRERVREQAADAELLVRLTERAETALAEVLSRAAIADPTVESAVASFEQAAADVRFLGIDRVLAAIARCTPSPRPSSTTPGGGGHRCPTCGGGMVKRWAKGGPARRRYFLGCARYPTCNGSRPLTNRSP